MVIWQLFHILTWWLAVECSVLRHPQTTHQSSLLSRLKKGHFFFPAFQITHEQNSLTEHNLHFKIWFTESGKWSFQILT
jgi:hypothetical protein